MFILSALLALTALWSYVAFIRPYRAVKAKKFYSKLD